MKIHFSQFSGRNGNITPHTASTQPASTQTHTLKPLIGNPLKCSLRHHRHRHRYCRRSHRTVPHPNRPPPHHHHRRRLCCFAKEVSLVFIPYSVFIPSLAYSHTAPQQRCVASSSVGLCGKVFVIYLGNDCVVCVPSRMCVCIFCMPRSLFGLFASFFFCMCLFPLAI